jgi:hypothetical protein
VIKKIIFYYFIILSFSSNAQVCSASASGNWNEASTWSCGRVPLCTDDVTIPNGITVTISSQINYNTTGCETQQMIITIGGTLSCQNGNKLTLPEPSYVIVESTGRINAGSGGGSSNWIKIGALDVWTAADGSVSGPFALNSECEITSGSPLTFSPANCGIDLLPIELIDFSATCLSNGVLLNWSTASELNNDYFLIERSLNGVEWEAIARVDGNGTTSEVHKYVHEDVYSSNSVVYYRLKQVDFNGSSTKHKMIDAHCDVKAKDDLLLYPNPSSTELNALFTMNKAISGAELKVMNMSGQIVMDTKIDLHEGLNTFSFPIDFQSGTYQVLVTSGDVFIPAQKIIVVKL